MKEGFSSRFFDRVFASGSVMLFGEHAVLHGEPAICMPIQEGIEVEIALQPATGFRVELNSSAVGSLSLSWEELLAAEFQASSAYYPHRFSLATLQEYLRLLRERDPSVGSNSVMGLHLVFNIDSSLPTDWGLGSSGALVAALLKALNGVFALYDPLHPLEDLWHLGLKIIRRVQEGQGSGSDLAASLYGQVVYVEKDKVSPFTKPRSDFGPWTLIYSGFKTPTPEVVRYVLQEQQGFPSVYACLYKAMGEVTRQAVWALETNNVMTLAKLMRFQQGLLYSLGVSHQRIDQIIQDLQYRGCALAAKISGSGLGDCVLVLGGDQRWMQAQYGNRSWILNGLYEKTSCS